MPRMSDSQPAQEPVQEEAPPIGDQLDAAVSTLQGALTGIDQAEQGVRGAGEELARKEAAMTVAQEQVAAAGVALETAKSNGRNAVDDMVAVLNRLRTERFAA